MVSRPELLSPGPGHRGALCWRFDEPVSTLSSAAVGGGLGNRRWILTIGVPKGYARRDLDQHAAEVRRGLDLDGPGATLFTAAEVSRVQERTEEGVHAAATVGITAPTWAADRSGGYTPWAPGTINIVVQLPVRVLVAALVNLVATVTEAKSQALAEAGVPGTGTASDAVVLTCPRSGVADVFGGPRSPWGSRAALAVHAAVLAGSVSS